MLEASAKEESASRGEKLPFGRGAVRYARSQKASPGRLVHGAGASAGVGVDMTAVGVADGKASRTMRVVVGSKSERAY